MSRSSGGRCATTADCTTAQSAAIATLDKPPQIIAYGASEPAPERSGSEGQVRKRKQVDRQRQKKQSQQRRKHRARRALLDDAVGLVRQNPDGWNEAALTRFLAERHNTSSAAVVGVINDAPALTRVRNRVVLTRWPSASAARADEPNHGLDWDELIEEVTFALSETDVESVLVEVPVNPPARLQLRFDKVRSRRRDEIWLAGQATVPALWRAYTLPVSTTAEDFTCR